MVIDPPDGRLPQMTAEGQRRAEETRRRGSSDEGARGPQQAYKRPEDLSSWVRCITRGLPGMMMPTVYNNGLQLVQVARLCGHHEGDGPRNASHPHPTT